MGELKRGWFLTGVFVFLSLVLSSLSIRGWSGIGLMRTSYIRVVFPVEQVFSFPLRKGSALVSFFRSHVDLIKENAQLKDELSLLRHKLYLLSVNGIKERTLREGFIPCNVVYRFPDRWFSEIVVDKGKDDGVSVGMAVLGANGLVGEVVEVSSRISRVKLITSRSSILGAMVLRSRSFGVLRGRGGVYCELLYIPEDEDVSLDDEVVTAGMGGGIPGGIRIGKIVHVSKKGEFMEVYVKPFEDLSKLGDLWILKGR